MERLILIFPLLFRTERQLRHVETFPFLCKECVHLFVFVYVTLYTFSQNVGRIFFLTFFLLFILPFQDRVHIMLYMQVNNHTVPGCRAKQTNVVFNNK